MQTFLLIQKINKMYYYSKTMKLKLTISPGAWGKNCFQFLLKKDPKFTK